MTQDSQKTLHTLLEPTVVKVFIGNTFKGTGFFISADGYVLTAYHCIGPYPPEIWVETCFDGKYLAQLEEDKSLKAEHYDIAVLRVFNHRPSHYVPLGFVSRENINDDVIAIGYPANEYRFYEGKIGGINEFTLASEVIKGEGQSGGLVYHCATRRVVGLASAIWKREVVVNEGLAARFEALFAKWSELAALNQQAIVQWERQLKENTQMELPKLPPYWQYGLAGVVLLAILVLMLKSCSNSTSGDCSPIVDKTTGNVSIDCTIGTSQSK